MDISSLATIKGSGKFEITKATSLAPSILAIGVSMLVLIFLVWPRFNQVLRLRDDNKQLANQANALEEKVKNLDNLNKDDLEAQLSSAEQLLPSDKGIFPFIAQTERAAGASGVLLSRVEIAPGPLASSDEGKKNAAAAPAPVASGNTQGADISSLTPKIQLRIAISGDYKSFLQFLNNILSASRVVAIRDLGVNVSSSSPSGSQVRASLLVEAYWQAIPAQLASIESPVELLTDGEIQRLNQVKTTGLSSTPTIPAVSIGRSDIFASY